MNKIILNHYFTSFILYILDIYKTLIKSSFSIKNISGKWYYYDFTLLQEVFLE